MLLWRQAKVRPDIARAAKATGIIDTASRETNGQLSLIFAYRVDEEPSTSAAIGIDGAHIDVTATLRNATRGAWQTLAIPLGCFARAGADMSKARIPFALSTSGRGTIALSDIHIASATVLQDKCSF